jgi:hypothetical protein
MRNDANLAGRVSCKSLRRLPIGAQDGILPHMRNEANLASGGLVAGAGAGGRGPDAGGRRAGDRGAGDRGLVLMRNEANFLEVGH